jgi:CHAT domain-containing protein
MTMNTALPSAHSHAGSSVLRSFLWLAVACLTFSIPVRAQTPSTASGNPQTGPTLLELGKPIERELRGGEKQSYKIHIEAGQFVNVVLVPDRIDVWLTLLDPHGKEIQVAYTMNAVYGPEPISVIAKNSGDLRLDVNTASGEGGAPGHYRIQLTDLRTPEKADRTRIDAERTFEEGHSLFTSGGEASYKAAAAKWKKSFALWQSLGDKNGQALSLCALGMAYYQSGQYQNAVDSAMQALPLERALGDRQSEAATLWDISIAYRDLGDNKKALEYSNQSSALECKVGSRHADNSSGGGLNDIGVECSRLGQNRDAVSNFNQALSLQRAEGPTKQEADTLTNLGEAYSALGEKQKALESYNEALLLERALGDHAYETKTLTAIGTLYSDLGENQKALDYFNQALPLVRSLGPFRLSVFGPWADEGVTLSNIARAYAALGDNQKALDYYTQALSVERSVGDRAYEAGTVGKDLAPTLSNIGALYSNMGENQKALDFFNSALRLRHAIGDRAGEAATLSGIGVTYNHLGDKQKAVSSELAALSLAKAVADPDLRGGIDAHLMDFFREQRRLEVAIFFGMDAVNSFQQIRKNISGLDKDLQAGYAQSKSATYRELAELLVQTDRLGEAEQVLDLLKEQELKEVVRGAADEEAKKVEPMILTDAQQKAQTELAAPEKAAEALTGISLEYGTLLAKEKRTPDDDARLKALDASIEKGNSDVSAFFTNTLYPQLAQKAATTDDANKLLRAEKSEVSQLQNTLAELGPRVMGIRLLLGEDHAYAIVVTAHTREKFELKATPAELRDKVLQVRDELRTPASNPKPHLAELYSMVVAPFADELKAIEQSPASAPLNRVPTLLWSLDGVLRYLPMNALFDGQHYMLERFNNVLFTPESYGHMAASAGPSGANLQVLAVGLSKSFGGLPALPGVMLELDAVVRDPAAPDSHGPMSGKLLSDEQFTLTALKQALGTGKSFSVVHIASHFIEQAGSGKEPYLMLGGENSGEPNGFQLTLSRMEDSAISLHGTQLLTLSACSTAKGDAAQDGQEMDSLGMIAQQKDAGAVLATLWDVADASTSELMSDFYGRWVAHPADGKAESLRQAQLALLHNSTATKTTPPSDYSHPFYWAPFVLFGNFN